MVPHSFVDLPSVHYPSFGFGHFDVMIELRVDASSEKNLMAQGQQNEVEMI